MTPQESRCGHPAHPASLTVQDLGEFGLIDRIRNLFPQSPPSVVVGIGDDVAVLRTASGRLLLATCDCQIEGVHFTLPTVPGRLLGRRAAAVNLSDMAAMGGTPLWALLSLMAPERTAVALVEEIYRGFGETLSRFGAAVVGGNTARHPDRLVMDVTLLGDVDPDRVILRTGARPGDLLVVTGTLGGSRAGLECLKRDISGLDETVRTAAIQRHWEPEPRLREGQILAASAWVHAMIDVSDGLMGDLGHLCRASGVGAVLCADTLPVDSACEAVAQAAGRDPLEWALYGGEDYELLAAVDPSGFPEIREALENAGGVPCRVIGRVVAAEEGLKCLRRDGTVLAGCHGAWDHFRKEGQNPSG